ncbi:hypothetical protein L6452_42516 [Arctium lappa]|uniref:Uncharacterized protein n=1 Tax=Arctium lappa TaxID=4217 RepID=A0ACB8XJA5_ARCLA|nr:hypothetical protein L6452_42516 [Arctium lappa]
MAFPTFSGNQDDPLCDPDWVYQSDPHLPDNLLQDVHQILKNFPPESTIGGSSLTTNGGSCSPENDSNDAKCNRNARKHQRKRHLRVGRKRWWTGRGTEE